MYINVCVYIYIYIYIYIYFSKYLSIYPSIHLIHIIFPCIPVFCGFLESVPKWHPFLFSRATPKAAGWFCLGVVMETPWCRGQQSFNWPHPTSISIDIWLNKINKNVHMYHNIYIYNIYIYSRTYVHRNICIYNI